LVDVGLGSSQRWREKTRKEKGSGAQLAKEKLDQF
jgi:hypothetical protein